MCSYFEYLNNHKSQFPEKGLRVKEPHSFSYFQNLKEGIVFMRELAQKKEKQMVLYTVV